MTPGDCDLLVATAARFGVMVDRATLERLDVYVDLLAVWNSRIRLTGARDTGEIVRKHVIDCLALIPLLPADGLVVDVGSGAGFPGLVVAAARPARQIALIEARRRRASFLGEAARSIGLDRTTVYPLRAEEAALDGALRGAAAMVMARGIRLDQLLPLARPLLAGAGTVVAMQTAHVPQPGVERLAAAAGFRLARTRDYVLTEGEERRLLEFSVSGSGAV